eukprot:gene10861-5915_t
MLTRYDDAAAQVVRLVLRPPAPGTPPPAALPADPGRIPVGAGGDAGDLMGFCRADGRSQSYQQNCPLLPEFCRPGGRTHSCPNLPTAESPPPLSSPQVEEDPWRE